MKSFAAIAIAFFFVTTGGDKADAAALRPALTVDADVVRLGDLFVDAGKKANAIVAAAPAPGGKTIFSAARLQSIARRAGLSWRPRSRHEKAVITRTGRLVSSGEIKNLIQSALTKKGMSRNNQIALSKENLTFHIGADDRRNVRIVQTRYNPQGNQFSAILSVPGDRSSSKRVQVTGSVYEIVNIPVLVRSVQRGEMIRSSDLDYVQKRRQAVGRNTILDIDRIIGKTPRRYLQTGKPIRMADLRMPILVSKGKLVTLTLKNRHMLITAQGKALEDGAKGDVIRVTNTRSRQTVQGVVTAPNRVSMRLTNILP